MPGFLFDRDMTYSPGIARQSWNAHFQPRSYFSAHGICDARLRRQLAVVPACT